MKYFFLFILLILVCSKSKAQNLDKWQLRHSHSTVDVYSNNESIIREGQTITVWLRWIYKDDANKKETKEKIKIDCAAKKVYILYSVSYYINEQISIDDKIYDMDIVPDTIIESLSEDFCK